MEGPIDAPSYFDLLAHQRSDEAQRSEWVGMLGKVSGWELGKLSAASRCKSATQQMYRKIRKQACKRASENDKVSKRVRVRMHTQQEPILATRCSEARRNRR